MERLLLMLSYLFPPRGGAGVQRALKFAKYLREFGWATMIVANREPAADRVTAIQDQTLLKDLPDDTIVRHTTLDDNERRRSARAQGGWRQRLAITDPTGWWVSPAVRQALPLIQERKPAAIFVTMSPFSAAEAGLRLKAMTGLPLVLDLRDPWALDETRIYPTRWHAWRDWQRMARALAGADLVVMNTPAARDAVAQAFALAPGTSLISLTNGFDADDFAHASIPPAPCDVLRIVHTGMFHSELAQVWDDLAARRGLVNKLKFSRRPIDLWTRTPRYLLAAIERLLSGGRLPPDKVELALVGELTAADLALVQASPVAPHVKLLGYRSHAESVGWLKSADVLFLPNHTPLDGGPALIVPGKTYEYLAAERPILAMGPPGDMRQFVASSRAGAALAGDDVAGAAEFLHRVYDAKRQGLSCVEPDRGFIAGFDRRELARQLAGQMDRVLARVAART